MRHGAAAAAAATLETEVYIFSAELVNPVFEIGIAGVNTENLFGPE